MTTDESMPVLPDALFLHFCETAEKVRATTKRLEKAAFLATYFATLADADLVLAARWLGGSIFPLTDGRTTNIGGAALVNALLVTSGANETHLRERLVALGDAGDVARELFAENADIAVRPPLYTLALLETFFADISATAGSKAKLMLLVNVLQTATPLEAKYIVKLLQGDLRIGLKEGAVEDAVARMHQTTAEAVQRVNMLTGDIGETALLARHGRMGEAKMRLFHPIKFMLATPAEDTSDVARQMPAEFIVEDKYDGIRAQAHIERQAADGEARVALFSRTLDDITRSFPDLVAPLVGLLPNPDVGYGLVLDGEIVPVEGEKILPFQVLQQRLGRKVLAQETLDRLPIAFVAYDVLYAGDAILLEESLSARRARLETLGYDGHRTRLGLSRTMADIAELDAEFVAARARGNEGLMVKEPSSLYKPGRRGREWLKIKKAIATLDVVITAAQVGEGRRSRFLSDYTFAVRASETDDTLLNVGKAYSGLTDVETEQLSEWCKANTIEQFAHGKVRTVTPQIVLEVMFDRVQPSARHKSGYALRFPRILRIREDKPVGEIDTLATVQRLAQTETTLEEPTNEEPPNSEL